MFDSMNDFGLWTLWNTSGSNHSIIQYFACFHSVVVNVHWIELWPWHCWQALTAFLRTKNIKKAMESFRRNQDSIDDAHRRIWPGFIVQRLRTKHHLASVADADQDVWFRETTLSSSTFIAFITFAISGKFRPLIDRETACTSFASLLALLCSSTGGFVLEHWPVGSGSDASVTLPVDQNGFVDGRIFWDEDYFISSVRRTWGVDYKNSQKKWLQSSNGRVSKMSLCELLCFCLDPQHDATMQDIVVGPTLDLLSEICVILDESVSLLQRDMERLDPNVDFKNQKRMARTVKRIWVESVARKVWSGKEPCHVKKVFIYLCLIYFTSLQGFAKSLAATSS